MERNSPLGFSYGHRPLTFSFSLGALASRSAASHTTADLYVMEKRNYSIKLERRLCGIPAAAGLRIHSCGARVMDQGTDVTVSGEQESLYQVSISIAGRPCPSYLLS
ncbi:hypothetical protein NDU88_007406 [Pleurodeles waltl]|uniref:Uncharacterized protein n=1 Tax=Pleurodeles waltl TaxID=8319 RepID=A0AAV7UNQ9_PLEWA|nr:hypothetical protein NDU88_007406 [Pleurodeles waltl]